MENELKKLQEKKRNLEVTGGELFGMKVLVETDSNFKMPEVASPRKPTAAAVAASPRNAGTVAKGPGGVDEIIPVGAYTPRPHNLPPEGDIVRKYVLKLMLGAVVLFTCVCMQFN
ncbi:hypothetical protein HPB48_005365 [Haemaphysalis longicornis]|uniref:Uncharacterized protein n=1 Tax=Haemaphysalis longicornis TaxID=44386 RepID=A0A9J6GHS1_HAELO|nr:hypothetical protein HPB48_005365 [Haemaphysalis longicornis]